jgi:hypothetical protein
MRFVFEQPIVERLLGQPYFNRNVCATVSTAVFRRLRVVVFARRDCRIHPASLLRDVEYGFTGIAYPFAEFAAVAGNEDGICGSTHLDRLSDRVSLPWAATLRPGFCGRTGRPRRRSNLAKNAPLVISKADT